MQHAVDVTVPDTKPATEYYLGRFVQKVSPRKRHGRAQGRIAAALLAWADDFGSGEVATEWEFHLAPPGESMNVFVPDVAYLPYARMRSEADDAEDIAYVAPAVIFEVLSPGNTRAEIDEKRRVFLTCGTTVFAIANPADRTLTVSDSAGTTTLDASQTFTHVALPDFELPVSEIFRRSPRR